MKNIFSKMNKNSSNKAMDNTIIISEISDGWKWSALLSSTMIIIAERFRLK